VFIFKNFPIDTSLIEENKYPNDKSEPPKKISIKEFVKESKRLFKDKLYLSILTVLSLTKGSFIGLNGIMIIILYNLGYSKLTGSVTVALGLLLGIVGSNVYSSCFALKKYQQLNLSILMMLTLVCLGFGFLFLALETVFGFIIMYGLVSFFWYPLIPMMLNSTSKISFRANKFIVNAYLMGFAQVVAFLFQMSSSFILKSEDGSFWVILIIVFFAFTSLWMLYFYLKID
jgi:hypothetical protein